MLSLDSILEKQTTINENVNDMRINDVIYCKTSSCRMSLFAHVNLNCYRSAIISYYNSIRESSVNCFRLIKYLRCCKNIRVAKIIKFKCGILFFSIIIHILYRKFDVDVIDVELVANGSNALLMLMLLMLSWSEMVRTRYWCWCYWCWAGRKWFERVIDVDVIDVELVGNGSNALLTNDDKLNYWQNLK